MAPQLLATITLLATLTTCQPRLDRLEVAEKVEIMSLVYAEALSVDSTLNTSHIWLDISAVSWLDNESVVAFLSLHPEVSLVRADTVLARSTSWQEKGNLPHTLIRVAEPEAISMTGSKIEISHTKFRSQSGGVMLRTVLMRKETWQVVETEFVGIS